MIKKWCEILVLVAVGIIFLIPLILIATNSLMTITELNIRYAGFQKIITFIPQKVSLSQYYILLIENNAYLGMFWRSVKLTVIIVILNIIYSVFMGSVLAKISRGYGTFLLFLYVLGMIMPYQVIMLPRYIQAKNMQLLGTDLSVILPAIFSPIGVVFITQVIKNIPNELIDYIQLETNSWYKVITEVIITSIKGPMVVLVVFVFAETWNMVDEPLTMFDQSIQYPLSVQLAYSQLDLSIIFPGCVIYIIPIILLYVYFQEALEDNLKEIKW